METGACGAKVTVGLRGQQVLEARRGSHPSQRQTMRLRHVQYCFHTYVLHLAEDPETRHQKTIIIIIVIIISVISFLQLLVL